MGKRLTLGNDKVIGGVCSGIGEYINVDTSIIRLILVFLLIFYGIGILPYLICWFVIPSK